LHYGRKVFRRIFNINEYIHIKHYLTIVE
jgi:hypothetical protein